MYSRRGRPPKAERDRMLQLAGHGPSSTTTGPNPSPFTPQAPVQLPQAGPSLSRLSSVQLNPNPLSQQAMVQTPPPPQAPISQPQAVQPNPHSLFYVATQHRLQASARGSDLLFGTGIVSIAPTNSGNVPFSTLVTILNDQAHDTGRDVSLPIPSLLILPPTSRTFKPSLSSFSLSILER
jgi:hypothetical protein